MYCREEKEACGINEREEGEREEEVCPTNETEVKEASGRNEREEGEKEEEGACRINVKDKGEDHDYVIKRNMYVCV